MKKKLSENPFFYLQNFEINDVKKTIKDEQQFTLITIVINSPNIQYIQPITLLPPDINLTTIITFNKALDT